MKTRIAAAILALGITSAARAEFFVGAGISNHSYDYYDVQNSNGTKLYGGYYTDKGVFVEAALVDLGNADVDRSNYKLEISGNTAFIGYRRVETSGMGFYGKVGVYSFDTKLNVAAGTESGSGLAWGFGLTYPLNRNFSIRGEIEQYVGVKDFAEDTSVTGGCLAIELRL